MQKKEKPCKTMSGHAFTQFELTQNLLNNLSQFELTPSTKLVLLYLSSCYNPKKADMFPKQKTIALKLGLPERTVIRAVCELVKQGLIIVERKYSNRYKFTSKIIGGELLQDKKFFKSDNLSSRICKNDISESDNLSPHDIEPKTEQIKEPLTLEEYKVLKDYAINHKAYNVKAYISKMVSNGSAKQIINTYNRSAKRYETGELKRIKKINSEPREFIPPEYFKSLRQKLGIDTKKTLPN